MNYIFDTSAVIVLVETCNLKDELKKFSKNNGLFVPLRVKEEFLNGLVSHLDLKTFEEVFSIISVELEKKLLPYFNFDDSDGAIWVISHGCKNSDCCCVIDEEFGRNICELFNARLTGALGIIMRMKEKGILSNEDLQEIKSRLRNSKFYHTEKLLNKL